MDVKITQKELKALASEPRTAVLKLLRERNHTLSELAQKMNMSSPSMKAHMDVLLDAGLAMQIDEGRKWKYYTLSAAGREIALGGESESRMLIVLGVSSIALVAVLVLFAAGIADMQFAAQAGVAGTGLENAPVLTAVRNAEDATASTVPAETALGAGYEEQAKEMNTLENAAASMSKVQMVYAYAALAAVLAVVVAYSGWLYIQRRRTC